MQSIKVKKSRLLGAEFILKDFLGSVACYVKLLITHSLFPPSFITVHFFLRWIFHCNFPPLFSLVKLVGCVQKGLCLGIKAGCNKKNILKF